MAWPQDAPPPAPPPSAPGSSLPVGALVAGISGVLTFLFSFVRIVKVDNSIVDVGWSVWTLNVGFFGVGTLIPLAALAAGLIALGRAFVAELDGKQAIGFGALQVQIALTVMAVLIWLGYMVSIVLASEDAGFPTSFGLGALLLFLGLAGLVAGTVMSVAAMTPKAPAPERPLGVPSGGAWPAPPADPNVLPSDVAQGPPSHAPAPPPPPAAAPPGPAGPPPGAPAPGQGWAPPPGPPAPGQGPPPAQPPPPPSGGGALIDPGTQVIPGPPPAPPPDQVNPPQPGFPPIPPSNT